MKHTPSALRSAVNQSSPLWDIHVPRRVLRSRSPHRVQSPRAAAEEIATREARRDAFSISEDVHQPTFERAEPAVLKARKILFGRRIKREEPDNPSAHEPSVHEPSVHRSIRHPSKQDILDSHAAKETPVKELRDAEEKLALSVQASAQKINKRNLDCDLADHKYTTEDEQYETSVTECDEQLERINKRKKEILEEERNVKKQKVALAAKRRESAVEYVSLMEENDRKIQDEKEAYLAFSAAYEETKAERMAAERKQLGIDHYGKDYDWYLKVNAAIGNVALHDIDVDDLQDKVGIHSYSDVRYIGRPALMWFLRLLKENNYGSHPDVQGLWDENRDTKWKRIHGQVPKIMCRTAPKEDLIQRVVTYLFLLDDRKPAPSEP